VAAEAVGGQVVTGGLVDDAGGAEVVQVRAVEAEALDGLQEALHSGEHPIAATAGQPTGEDLEGDRAIGHAAGQRGAQHGELVVIGEQPRTRQ